MNWSEKVAQLLSFLSLPKVKTFNGRFFRNTELIIELILRKVGNEAMENVLDEDIMLTLTTKKIISNWKKDTYMS